MLATCARLLSGLLGKERRVLGHREEIGWEVIWRLHLLLRLFFFFNNILTFVI